MVKSTRSDLLEAGLRLLGEQGAKAFTVRRIEDSAEVTHGTIRHHFGSYESFLAACVDELLAADGVGGAVENSSALGERDGGDPLAGEGPDQLMDRWLGAHRYLTRARYELALMSTRDPELSAKFVAARDSLVAVIEAGTGLSREDALALMAALDGLVLDAILRGNSHADPGPILRRFGLDEA